MAHVNKDYVADAGASITEIKQEVDVEFDEFEETMELGLFGKEEEETGTTKLEEEELDHGQEEVVVKLEPKEIKKEEIGMGSGGGELKDPLEQMMSPQLQLQPTSMLLTLHISKETRANPTRNEIEFKAVPLVNPRKTNRNAVPDSSKDVKYYERCAKNAAATKHTRAIKRIKMAQLATRAEFLRKACNELQDKIQAVKSGRPINITTTTIRNNYNNGDGGLSRQILHLENIYNQNLRTKKS